MNPTAIWRGGFVLIYLPKLQSVALSPCYHGSLPAIQPRPGARLQLPAAQRCNISEQRRKPITSPAQWESSSPQRRVRACHASQRLLYSREACDDITAQVGVETLPISQNATVGKTRKASQPLPVAKFGWIPTSLPIASTITVMPIPPSMACAVAGRSRPGG